VPFLVSAEHFLPRQHRIRFATVGSAISITYYEHVTTFLHQHSSSRAGPALSTPCEKVPAIITQAPLMYALTRRPSWRPNNTAYIDFIRPVLVLIICGLGDAIGIVKCNAYALWTQVMQETEIATSLASTYIRGCG
jgi:hypothetical protein